MNVLDLAIILLAVAAGVGGWRLGFVARATSWLGLAAGTVVAARLMPVVVDVAGTADPTARLLVGTGTLLGGAFIGQAIGLVAGSRLHVALPGGPAQAVDRSGGGVAGVLGVFAVAWLLLPAMADVPGTPARLAGGSAIARAIEDVVPAPPDTLEAFRQLVGEQNFPRVFNDLGAAPDVGPPPTDAQLPEEVVTAATAATVKLQGTACRRIQEGSGVALAPGLVVTNAHVVAGERDTQVLRSDGTRTEGQVVLFDADRDLAVVRVPDSFLAPLPLADGGVGLTGGVFGHPAGGPLRITPFQVRERVRAVGRDLYNAHDIERDVYVLAAELHPGDSGGPLVAPSGEVVGVAFAIAPDRPNTAYGLTAAEVGAVLDAARSAPADTGPCLAA